MKKLLKAPVGVQLSALFLVSFLIGFCVAEPLISLVILAVLLLLLAVFTVADWWWDNR